MPLKPRKNEDKSKFVSRAISELSHTNPDRPHLQNVAIAYQYWRDRRKNT
jgi:hypothetical protein